LDTNLFHPPHIGHAEAWQRLGVEDEEEEKKEEAGDLDENEGLG
jgi:hypothetical protein